MGQKLSARFPAGDLEPSLALLAAQADFVLARALDEPVCEDPDDDKFIACAIAGKCDIVVSGDAMLLQVSGYRGVRIETPRRFVDGYLAKGT